MSIIEGYLDKKALTFPYNWKHRYFVLIKNQSNKSLILEYYENESKINLKKRIEFQSQPIITSALDRNGRFNCFEINFNNEKLFLSAKYMNIKNEWIDNINNYQYNLNNINELSFSTNKSKWHCQNCGIFGTYASKDISYCGGAYFGWILGATPTDGRTCCNCVKRITGSDAGYSIWGCTNCKKRKIALKLNNWKEAGFQTGMEITPLITPEGIKWLNIEDGNQSGPEWLRRSISLRLNNLSFKNIDTFLPNPIHTYTNIISLNISNNLLLESLPVQELCNMKNLKELHCLNCPLLISPPPEVCSLGGFEVMIFLREVVLSGTLSKSMVLFFIGNGESGKTSTLQALKSKNNLTNKIAIDKRTVGIDISSLNLMNQYDINFHVYDMAGQNIYKDTHTYFVGRRAIYLFVWKLKKITDNIEEITNNMKEMIESWVNTLQYRIPGSSILFVGTHADCVTETDIKSQSLLIQKLVLKQIEKYTSSSIPIRILNHGESLIIDSVTGRGISNLRSNIALFGKSLPWYNEPIPKSWIELEKKLEEKLYIENLKFLSWESYIDICTECGIDEILQKSCTRFMHETGKIRYFGYDIKENKNNKKKLISNNKKSSITEKIKKKISIFNDTNDDSYELISDESIKRSLNDTVFISPSWVCDVLKGVIRHDRDLLLRYFLKCNDLVMVRRVKHAISHGIIHDSIVNYLWPSKIISSSKSLSSSSLEYWNEANISENESDIWVENVIKCREDISRALSILVGFDLISLKGKKLIVPVLLKKSKIGNNLINITVNHNLIKCPYVSVYEYTGLPGGFFERIAIRMTKWSFHTDIGSNITISYLLGNIGQIQLYKSSNGNNMFSIQATSRYCYEKINNDLQMVEQFFPGLTKNTILTTDININSDPIQICIICSNYGFGFKIQQLFLDVNPYLNIELFSEMSSINNNASIPRLAIICIDDKLSSFSSLNEKLLYFEESGCIIIPVILEGYNIVKYESWWPLNIPMLERHKLFVDLRNNKLNFNDIIKKTLYPQIIKLLEDWMGYSNNNCNDLSKKKNDIKCLICKEVEITDPYYFKRNTCINEMNDWQSRQLQFLERQLYSNNNNNNNDDYNNHYNNDNEIKKILEPFPTVICEKGHVNNIKTLLSSTTYYHMLPCPNCIEKKALNPHLFKRDDLLCIFDDDNLQKQGRIFCPECRISLRILDVINCDVFVSYNWGYQKSTQVLIKPLIQKIELDTNSVCWFDIQGGLSAGQDIIREMEVGVANCIVFLLFLSDSYILSTNCRLELLTAIKNQKYIIPILVPDNGLVNNVSSGWSGNDTSIDWWKDCIEISKKYEKLNSNCDLIPWSALRNYKPIDLRKFYNNNDTIASSSNNSILSNYEEIVCRIMSRYHRNTI